MIKCIIVEDELLAQDVIKSHLQHFDKWELVGVYPNAASAAAALQAQEVDVMFLDIRLPGMSGLQLLRQLSHPPLVILTTAYSEYAVESYEFSVIDYLLKPISLQRFSMAIGKIENDRLYTAPEASLGQPLTSTPERAPDQASSRLSADHIFIRSNSKFFKVNFSEIRYVEGMRDYLKVHTHDYTLVTHQTMNELEKLLPARSFLRVHKSFMVAIGAIKAIYGNSIELDKVTIPIGVNYKEKVMELVGKA